MVKRVRKPLTQRERQCRQVAREKALRKWKETMWRRVRLGCSAAVVACAFAAIAWELVDEGFSRFVNTTVEGGYRITANAGFAVTGLYLDGRNRTPLYDVKTAMDVSQGDPILALDIEALRQRLEQLPTVKKAEVLRILPGTLQVKLHERTPVAIWQYEGKFALIDDEGAVMPDLSLKDHANLPLVIGKGAPEHIKDALALLSQAPELKSKVTAAIRVSDRRWDLRMAGGVEVRLPEKDALTAWNKLRDMHKNNGVLDRAVLTLDLRQQDRMIIRMAPSEMPSVSPTYARET